jgi:undecaprenyl-phosphate 4-deoxy-4-formamido-L-arabinose transferase
LDWELILVDDASRDDSWRILEELHKSDPMRIKALRFNKNSGQHAALLAGVRFARKDLIVTMDDDLQHRPDTIPRLVDALSDEVDLVYGIAEEEEHALWRNWSSRVSKWALAAVIGDNMAQKSSAFRVFRTSLRESWNAQIDMHVTLDVLLSWVTSRYQTVTVPMDVRTSGTSNYTFRKLIHHLVNMVTGYTTRPLRYVSLIGLLASLVGLGSFLFVVIQWLLFGSRVPGFVFLASLTSLLAGAQLFSLGIIGEYLARMYTRTMNRPAYVVTRVLD